MADVPAAIPLVFPTPQADLANGNDMRGIVIDPSRWAGQRILDYSVIFTREVVYNAQTGVLDGAATDVLLANNSLHYKRTTDVERFFVVYNADGITPMGIGFGSFGSPQNWVQGLGQRIDVDLPLLGGIHIQSYQDDMPLTAAVDPRVVDYQGLKILPWGALEDAGAGDERRKLYISTPNHLFDVVNRNGTLPHMNQYLGEGQFTQRVVLPSGGYKSAEDVACDQQVYPDQSSRELREIVHRVAQLRGKEWLF